MGLRPLVIRGTALTLKPVSPAAIKLLTPKEAAELLKVSVSWLAKPLIDR